MKKVSTKVIVLNGLMIALVFLVTYTTKIPGPVGPFNIGDAAIMVTAVLLGRKSGLLAGAIGSAAADIAMGYAFFSPFTFVVKGLEGYVTGTIVNHPKLQNSGNVARILGVTAGALVMISGYFVAELFILPLFNKDFGWIMAVRDLVSTNLLQGGVSAVVGYSLSTVLLKTNVIKFISK